MLAHRLALEVVDARARGQPADGHRVDVPRRAEHDELDPQRREARRAHLVRVRVRVKVRG